MLNAVKYLGIAAAAEDNKQITDEEIFVKEVQRLALSDSWLPRFKETLSKRFDEEELLQILRYRRTEVAKKEIDLAQEIGGEQIQLLQQVIAEVLNQYPNEPVQAEDQVIEVTAETFSQEVEESNLPVALKIHAPWCGPCKLMSPTFKTLAAEFEGKCKFASFNLDEDRAIAEKYDITRIPAILLIKEGKLVDKCLGIQSQESLRSFIGENLK